VKGSILYRAPGNKNNIPPCSYLVLLQPLPYRLSHPALYPIPCYGLPDPPPDREAEAAMFQIVALNREHQKGMDPCSALAPEALKVGIRSKTVLAVHIIARPWLHATGQTSI
jgi:hypothetical protein